MADNRIISFLRNHTNEMAEKYGLSKTEEDTFTLAESKVEEITKKLIHSDLSAIQSLITEKEKRQKEIDEYTRKVREAKMIYLDTASRLDAMSDPKKIFQAKQKELNKVLKTLAIRHVEYKENNVFIFTTEFIRFKGIILGYYRIWMDFNRSSSYEGIRIINFYKRNGGLDHPCISGGSLCMGNSRASFDEAWKTKNVFTIVETCIAFLTSGNISHGYMHDWKKWAAGCKRVPRTLSFESLNIRPSYTSPQSNYRQAESLFDTLLRDVQLQEVSVVPDDADMLHSVSFRYTSSLVDEALPSPF